MPKKAIIINPISGKRLKDVLKENHKTQREIAKELNYVEQHISAIIHGRKNLTPETAKEISRILPVRFEYLMGYDDYKTEKDKQLFEKNIEADSSIKEERKTIEFLYACFVNSGYEIYDIYEEAAKTNMYLISEIRKTAIQNGGVNEGDIDVIKMINEYAEKRNNDARYCVNYNGTDIKLKKDDIAELEKEIKDFTSFIITRFLDKHQNTEQ